MIYLGLGSNQGDRRANLESAIARLRQVGFEVSRVSPVVESPAMLPDDAEPSWNVPYLNCAVEGNYAGSPQALLAEIKGIEQALGREPARRWSPRPADIDILLWHDQVIRDENLVVPHVGIVRRDFVVTPLLHLLPSLPVAGLDQSVFNISGRVPPIPLWMGILNITPDSFSDGGIWHDDGALSHQLDEFLLHNVQIVDVGAESTRPRAEEITTDEEWGRLEPVLDMVHEKVGDRYLKPWLSLDSRHASTVARAVERGIDVINDVTGLTDLDMIAIARNSGCQKQD